MFNEDNRKDSLRAWFRVMILSDALQTSTVASNIRNVFRKAQLPAGTTDYHAIPTTNEEEALEEQQVPATKQVKTVSWKIILALFVTSCAGLLFYGFRVHELNSDRRCATRMSAYCEPTLRKEHKREHC
jgi:hypothetical protein